MSPIIALFNVISDYIPSLALFLGYLLVIYGVYRLSSVSISSASKRKMLSPHSENLFRLILRVAAIFTAILAIFHVYNLPISWFLGSSAFVGAFLGFGSSQTINNVVAGFYVMRARISR